MEFLAIKTPTVFTLNDQRSPHKATQRPGTSVSGKILIPLVNLSVEKTMVANVISELTSTARLEMFPDNGH